MAVKRRSRKKMSTTPARRRRSVSRISAAPIRKRRKKSGGMLSAGANYKAVAVQVAMAAVGGAAGVALRNSIPATLSDYMKAGITVAAGVAVAMVTKQPMIGAGMIGTGAALATRAFGAANDIPLLSDQMGTGYNRLSESVNVYADEMGQPLQRIGNQFYYANGNLSSYTPQSFMAITA